MNKLEMLETLASGNYRLFNSKDNMEFITGKSEFSKNQYDRLRQVTLANLKINQREFLKNPNTINYQTLENDLLAHQHLLKNITVINR